MCVWVTTFAEGEISMYYLESQESAQRLQRGQEDKLQWNNEQWHLCFGEAQTTCHNYLSTGYT